MTISRSERRSDPQSILLWGQKREVFALPTTYPLIQVLLKITLSIWHPLLEKNRPKAKAKDTVRSFPKTGNGISRFDRRPTCPAATAGCYGPPLCIRPIAMAVGMCIVAHNGTELARWTCTSTQSQLFSLLVQSGADLHTCSCRSAVNSWSAESAPGLCDHRISTSEERTPSTCVSCRSTRTQLGAFD